MKSKFIPLNPFYFSLETFLSAQIKQNQTIPGSDPPDLAMLKVHGLRKLKGTKLNRKTGEIRS